MSQANSRAILEIHLKGGLLLGGSPAAGFNDTTLRDAEGLPYFPASALKGAIREQLARLVNEEQAKRILGGKGASSLEGVEAQTAAERTGGGSTRVYFTDATLSNESDRRIFARGSARGYAARTQVAIDRRSRRSRDQHLFNREIVAPFPQGLQFRAEVDLGLLDGEDRNAFRAAVAAVFAVGGGRTGGLGGVEMKLVEPSEPAASGREAGEQPCDLHDAPLLELEIEALDPLCLGPDLLLGNFQRTLGYLPATVLRGAIVTAALQARGQADRDRSGEPWFRELVLDPGTCLRFGDALPTAQNPQAQPRRVPFSLQTCKYGGAEHGVTDTLIRHFIRAFLARNRLFVATEDACGRCGERLIYAKQLLGSPEPERRVTTRLALEHGSGRSADGQLFSAELLERGTRFVALIAGVGTAGRKLLAAASSRPLRLGHGRGQGYGRARIVAARAATVDDLRSRLERLDGWVRQALEGVAQATSITAVELEAGRRYFTVTLTSDLAPTRSQLSAEEVLLAELGLEDVEIVHGQVRAGQRGGWDARRHRPKPYRPILRAGSTLLLATARPFTDLLPNFAELELRGAGDAREEGFGWLRCSDPIHDPNWRKP